jgi:deazaflavin-dependent oxidoreductase (nitroreductase family)
MPTMSTATSAPAPRAPAPPRRVARLFNRLVLPLAGTRLLPLYGVLEHRGRRSGKIFRTPVVARPTDDGFLVPMPWGERTDWYRNVRAAGGCVMRWNSRVYPLVQPEVIDVAAAGASFGAFQQAALSRFGITHCLRLRHRGAGAQAHVVQQALEEQRGNRPEW